VPRREGSPGFGERLKRLRIRLGYSTAADFARKMGLSYPTYRQWEVFNATPGVATLVKAIRTLEVAEPEKLALWLAMGEGEPAWLTPEGALDQGLKPELARPEEQEPPPPPAVDGAGDPTRIPWLAIRAVAELAWTALTNGDQKQLAAIAAEFKNLVRPHIVERRRSRRADAKQ
jgi:transcriptional regulator with XRE-family HTH domain